MITYSGPVDASIVGSCSGCDRTDDDGLRLRVRSLVVGCHTLRFCARCEGLVTELLRSAADGRKRSAS